MKSLLLILVLFVYSTILVSNPIPVQFISELIFDEQSDAYTIELATLYMYGFENLDNIMLCSDAGCSFFKPGINVNTGLEEAILITIDSLQDPLYINPAGDYIYLMEDGYILDFGMTYGNHPDSKVTAPSTGESILAQLIYCMSEPYSFYWEVKCYPPTPLDSIYHTSCRGTLSGYLYDKNLTPIPGAELLYCDENCFGNSNPPLEPIYTDINGYFFNDDMFGKIYKVEIRLESVTLMELDINIEIDSNNYYEIVDTNFIVGLTEEFLFDEIQIINHPNPFTNNTTFDLNIPESYPWNEALITVVDMNGKIVDRIAHQNPGDKTEQKINWYAPSDLKPGIYIYIVEIDSKHIASNKMILVNE